MRFGDLNLSVSGGALLRTLLISASLLAALAPARADILELSFSGTYATALGVIQAGDTFSGDIEWDSATTTNLCPGNPTYEQCIPVLSEVLTLPSADGLSVPGATVLYGQIQEVTAGVFDFAQINVLSSVDGNAYSFYISSGNVGVEDDLTTAGEGATNFTSSGPTVVPEPGSLSLAVLALLLPVSLVARRRMTRRQAR